MSLVTFRTCAIAATLALAASDGARALHVGGIPILPEGGEVAGRDAGELGAEWWRFFAEDFLGSPNLGNPYDPGPLAGQGVSFLYGLPAGASGTLRASVQPDQSVLWPLVPWVNIATDPAETAQDLLAQLEPLVAETTALEISINGEDFASATGADPLAVLRATFPDEVGESGLDVTLSDPNLFGLPPGPAGPMVSDGYWMVLGPLPPGEHVLSVTATNATGGYTVVQRVTSVPLPPTLALFAAVSAVLAGAAARRRASA